MRYFLDTEFNGPDLLSIALVPMVDSPRFPSFYRVIEQSPAKSIVPWVAEHVIPALLVSPIPRSVATLHLGTYLRASTAPEVVADWPTDFVHLLELLTIVPGQIESVPNLTMKLIDFPGFDAAGHSRIPHNAQADAEALRDEYVRRYGW